MSDEKFIIPLKYDPAIAHITQERDNQWRGYVYGATQWSDITGSRSGWSYFDEHSDGTTDDVGQARCSFQFTLCWRGTVEAKIWFTADEYDEADLLIMHRQWRFLRAELLRRMKADGCEVVDDDFVDELKPDELDG